MNCLRATAGHRQLQRTLCACRHAASMGLATWCLMAVASSVLVGPAFGTALRNTAGPDAIYWKQNLFLIPYEFNSADPVAAQSVWLYVSKDGGVNWQKISEARPDVRAFNYHAEGDGEYSFAIRTIDFSGRPWPVDDYQPELRVVVDTTMPRIEELRGALRGGGELEIRWRAVDSNIDPSTWQIEVQTDANGPWEPVSVPFQNAAGGVSTGQTIFRLPPGCQPVAMRAAVNDRAGNSAVFNAKIDATASSNATQPSWPALIGASQQNHPPTGVSNPFASVSNQLSQPVPPTRSTQPLPTVRQPINSNGWMSAGNVIENPYANNSQSQSRSQPWPADRMAQSPFQAANGNGLPGNTVYGNPQQTTGPTNVVRSDDSVPRFPQRMARVEQPSSAVPDDRRLFKPMEPFRQASNSMGAAMPAAKVTTQPATDSLTWLGDARATLPPGVVPKLVNVRTFALEYELESVGNWGVSKVELWGTRDGGATWRSYAQDKDNRSPLYVTVDGPGLYGFRILVEGAGGPSAYPPRSGDQPELWIAVDLEQPQAELLSVDPGTGNMTDHMILRWTAEDENLEPRPISIFYSSRPGGPWSAVATGLENTGVYAWRTDRHVPSRYYLRLEARDTAGNVGAYQMTRAIRVEPPQPKGHIRAVQPVQ